MMQTQTPTLPRVNTLIQLELPGRRRPIASRIEDQLGATVTIAAPDWPGDPIDEILTLRWSCDLGECAVRGIVVGVESRPFDMWVLRTDHAPRVMKPRAHERVLRALEVVVDVVDRRPPVRFTAETLDLGRGGLRLVTHDWVQLHHNDDLRLRLGHEDPPAIAAGRAINPLRVRDVLEFSVTLREPVPERAGLLLRRLARLAADEQPVTRGWRR
jgi:hypothetical protein